jgi:hypothetical protein
MPISVRATKGLLAASFVLLLTGCGAFQSVTYNTELQSVERSERAAEQYGGYTLTRAETEEGSRHVYEDGLLRISWLFDNTTMRLDVENKTAYSLRVWLDKGTFTLPDGRRSRLVRGDMSYQERNAGVPPLIVPSADPIIEDGAPGASVHLLPRSKIDFTGDSGRGGGYGSIEEILKPTAGNADSAAVRENLGKRFSVTLPIGTRRRVDNYTFVFEVVGAKIPGGDEEDQVLGEYPAEE